MKHFIVVLTCLLFLNIMPTRSIFAETLSVNDKDMTTQIKSLQEKADYGNSEAQFILGYIYKEGKDLPQNLSEAIRLFTQAANNNITRAQYALGEMYDKGDGVIQSYSEAIKWYRMAAENGYKFSGDSHAVRAGIRLNVMYSNGVGVEKDEKYADKWLQIIYENGKGESLMSAGDYYFYLHEPPKAKIGLKLYEVAAEQGNIEAFNKLGEIYKDGRGGVSQDYEEAIKWYSKSARLHNVEAQQKLGDIYKEGRHGVPQNYKEALKWYQLAANQGDAFALDSLGIMYEDGKGVPKNLKEAVRLFELSTQQYKKMMATSKSSSLGNDFKRLLAKRQLLIGLLYSKGGVGLAKNNVKAYAWLTLSSANGFEKADEFKEDLVKKMNHSQIEKAQKLAKEIWAK